LAITRYIVAPCSTPSMLVAPLRPLCGLRALTAAPRGAREGTCVMACTREILLEGRSINPPTVQGMSGGGIFWFRRRTPETTKLVGVLIEHRNNSCGLVGTRAAAAMSVARGVLASHPDAFL
jgi:hypothetical protein